MSPRYLSAERVIAAAGASFACADDDPAPAAASDAAQRNWYQQLLFWLSLRLKRNSFTPA